VIRRVRPLRRRHALIALVAVVLPVCLLAPAPAGGQPSPDPRTRRNELSHAIEDASAAEVAAIQELEAATARRQELEARVAALDQEVADAVKKVEAAEAEIARIAAQIETVRREIERIRAEIELSKARFNQSTVSLYKGSGNGSDSVLAVLSTADGAHELVAGSKYLGQNSRQFERELQRQGSLKDQLGDAEYDLRKEEARAREAERVAAEERDRVTQARAAADAEREQAAAAEAAEQQLIESIRARKAEFEAEYEAVQAQIEAEIQAALARAAEEAARAAEEAARAAEEASRAPAPASRAPAPATGPAPGPAPRPGPVAGPEPAPGPAPSAAPSAPAPSRNARFIWPVNGPVASGFGPRRHPIYGGTRMHTGVDVSAPSGTPIRAADDGVVIMVGPNGGYGNWTLIDHGDGLATGYAHQSTIGVSRGQRVSRGDIIGRVGSTGASTGPHLHWEVRVNGNPVNPMSYV
jgi:murein DD-endopeptidase MepM/ murein hydrolase activator NlpD